MAIVAIRLKLQLNPSFYSVSRSQGQIFKAEGRKYSTTGNIQIITTKHFIFSVRYSLFFRIRHSLANSLLKNNMQQAGEIKVGILHLRFRNHFNNGGGVCMVLIVKSKMIQFSQIIGTPDLAASVVSFALILRPGSCRIYFDREVAGNLLLARPRNRTLRYSTG